MRCLGEGRRMNGSDSRACSAEDRRVGTSRSLSAKRPPQSTQVRRKGDGTVACKQNAKSGRRQPLHEACASQGGCACVGEAQPNEVR